MNAMPEKNAGDRSGSPPRPSNCNEPVPERSGRLGIRFPAPGKARPGLY
jgi:hypothetical protein